MAASADVVSPRRRRGRGRLWYALRWLLRVVTLRRSLHRRLRYDDTTIDVLLEQDQIYRDNWG